MEDLRVRASSPNIVATLPTTNRAVIGVKRLKDSAVPWGLAVSGMSNQLVLFDVRFPRQPLFELHGHVNTYHTSLALATSPDDTVLLAGGSDRRLRAWSTVTGERIQPPASAGRRNALTMEYRHYVQHIDVSEDLTLRVASAGDVLRFLPPRDTPRGRVKVG
jgi:WD repeat-containing protein 21A